jgi:hypothetical protein
MEMVNPLAAFREGWDTTQGLFDARTRKQAGNALAAGDYRGGGNLLLGGGMLDEGLGLLQYDQRQQQGQVEAQRAQEQAAKAAQAERLKLMLGGAQSLLQVPPEQRRQAYQAQVRPLLQQQGVPDELLARFDQSGFTDGELQPFVTTLGGKLQEPEWKFFEADDGSLVAYDQGDLSNRMTLREADPFYARRREAEIAAIRAQEEQRRAAAAKARRGPAPRGGARTSSGAAAMPPGFVLE